MEIIDTRGAIEVYENGAIYDRTVQDFITDPSEREFVEEAAKYVGGRVLEIGLGNGWLRHALIRSEHCLGLLTIERSQDVIDHYLSRPWSRVTARYRLEQADGFARVAAVASVVDAVVVHLCPSPAAAQVIRMRAALTRANQRILALLYDPGLAPAGFSSFLCAETDRGLRAEVWDRLPS